jgi:uncharacterized protein with PQ loop repeat
MVYYSYQKIMLQSLMPDAIHHVHKRKRIHQNKEPYPHPNQTKRVVDVLVYVAGIVSPIAATPQVLKIWLNQEAGSISLTMFSVHLVTNFVWLIYGFLHKEKPIVILYTLWLIMNSLIVVGTILYG